MNDCIEDTYKFVQTHVAAAYDSTPSVSKPIRTPTRTTTDPATVVDETLKDLLRIGSRLSLPHVRSPIIFNSLMPTYLYFI